MPSRRLGKKALRRLLETGQRVGVDILPRHFYSQIPDLRALRTTSAWRRPYRLTAVQGTDLDAQLAWFRTTCPPEVRTTLGGRRILDEAERLNGAQGYGPVEAELLYCVVAARRPQRLVQIGAGVSTAVAQMAASDHGVDLDITCVDPFPTRYLTERASAGELRLRQSPVQELDPSFVDDLRAGDVLFVDSTHTVSPGSDVNFIVLELLPRLRRGVLVHFHDIMLPFDYSPRILSDDLFFWSETALVAAYLTDNPRVTIRLCCAMLHRERLAEARQVLPAYAHPLETTDGLAEARATGAFPSALWLEILRDPA